MPGAGRGDVGGPAMIPAGGSGKGPGEDEDHERKVWTVEDDDVWGGSPREEDDDPYS